MELRRGVPAGGQMDRRRSVILVRHAHTVWTAEGRYQGRSDLPLTSDGIGAATCLAVRLRDLGIASVVASPLARAFHTAQIVAASLGLAQPKREPRLMEVAYGDWEGMTQQEVRQRWPDHLEHWKKSPSTFQFPGGEDLEAASGRLYGFLQEQHARFDEDPRPIVAVTHCGLIRIAVLDACAAPIERFRQVRVEPGSAHRFLIQSLDANRKARLRLVEHL